MNKPKPVDRPQRLIACFVPSCPNTTTKRPDKLFVVVNKSLKQKWCMKVNIHFNPARRLYCCEDHLNLKEDLENYNYWKLIKGKAIMKSTARLRNYLPNEDAISNQDVVQIAENQEPAGEFLKQLLQSTENLPQKLKLKEKCNPSTSSASTHPILIDVATQCEPTKMVNKSTMVWKLKKKAMPSRPPSDFKHPSTSPSTSTCTSPSIHSFSIHTEELSSTDTKTELEQPSRKAILKLIYNNPKMYLGLPKQYLWLIKYITEKNACKLKEIFIIIALFKLKQNDTMARLSDEFEISRRYLSRTFVKAIEILGNFFQNHIYMPKVMEIKRNLPLVFKIRYSNVQCIIDAFEIEIQKPSNPQHQSQTWSQYKHCNTVKYLVGCTPNGFICFLSKGFGGRISDKALVEKSDFINSIPDKAVVMADRGFKEIETLLMTKGVRILRPPSVYASVKPTKDEVIQTKVIASLRVHVERVIRRIREFRFLKPHSVLSYKHVGYLDELVTIACGLINLQSEIIKCD